MVVYLNGEYLARDQATISVDDRGFVFGDGVYEVTRACEGRLFEADRHLSRLDCGLRALRIDVPATTLEALRDISERLLIENALVTGEATVYLQITRGVALRTHCFPAAGTEPTVFLSALPFISPTELRARGSAAITHPDIRWARCDLKTVNLLPNVLAKQHAVEAGVTEAILIRDGAITEGASTNVFGVIGGEVRTYPQSNYILAGITRAVVLELAAELGIVVRETPLFLGDLGRLDELFLTGTTTDVLPVVRLDGRPVGDGRPGPVATALYRALTARMAGAAAAPVTAY